MVIWFIGMSGAGKTTLGRKVYEALREENDAVVFLDGDILRDVWGDALGHDMESRRLNAHRISHLCAMLDVQGITVVAAVLSIFPEWQQWNREHFSDYVECYLKAPLEALMARDANALYRQAMEKVIDNVVGVDIEFPQPAGADLTVDTSGTSGGPEQSLKAILEYLGSR